jgi:flagellar protein FlgJ
MDVNGLGTAFFDDYRLTASSTGLTNYVNQTENTVNNAINFAETLKKAAAEGENAAENEKTPFLSMRPSAPKIDKTDKLYEQCQALETFLIKNLLTSMRSTVQKSGLIEEGYAGKIYEDMLYDEYAKDFTKNAGFGLADQAYLELTGQLGKVRINNP